MNISEVIEKVKSYCPSEYEASEIMTWCNEVSAMLASEVEDDASFESSDKTLCNSPYDVMYIDYVLAKIALYQRDFNAYNQHISLFNTRLDAYKCWMMSNPPHKSEKLKNWW